MTPLSANAPGPRQPAPCVGGRAGFTLIEIVLALALIGLVAALFFNSAADLFRSREVRTDDVFWQAVMSARQLALETNEPVILRFDDEKRALAWTTAGGAAGTLAFPGKSLEFLPVTEQSMVLLGGRLTETTLLKRVRFYPDGGCDAFRAQLVDAAGRRMLLSIDQWTCAPVLAAVPK